MSRILVIDDEPSIRAAFVEVLSAEGHHVVDAGSAEAALPKLAGEPIDLVITDVCLPGMSGLEVLEQIRRLEPKLPVIVMTGFGTMQTAIEATKRGAFDYHLKPLDPAALMVTVERALEAARLTRRQVAMGPETQVTIGPSRIATVTPIQIPRPGRTVLGQDFFSAPSNGVNRATS